MGERDAIEGDSLTKLMASAKRMWTNDTYWMLMPYKLRDPGVILKYDGEVKDSTATTTRSLGLRSRGADAGGSLLGVMSIARP